MTEFLELLEKVDALVASFMLMIPLLLQWRTRAAGLAAEVAERRDEGLLSLAPLVVRKAHEYFAAYKLLKGKSHPEKKKYLEDLIVAAHSRRNGESAIKRAEVQRVLAKAESYWKENKLVLKAELAADPSNNLPPLPGIDVDMGPDITNNLVVDGGPGNDPSAEPGTPSAE